METALQVAISPSLAGSPQKRHTRQSDTEIETRDSQKADEKADRPSTHGRRSNTVLEVETATSSFAKNCRKVKELDGLARNNPTLELPNSKKQPGSSAKVPNKALTKDQAKKTRSASSNGLTSRKRKALEGRRCC